MLAKFKELMVLAEKIGRAMAKCNGKVIAKELIRYEQLRMEVERFIAEKS